MPSNLVLRNFQISGHNRDISHNNLSVLHTVEFCRDLEITTYKLVNVAMYK